MTECVLCVDIGTTSLKAGLISANGEVVSFCTHKFLFPHSRHIAKTWICSLKKQIKKINSDCKKNQVKILALSISGNGPTVVTQNGFTVRWNQEYKVQKERVKSSLFMPKILELKERFPKEYNKTAFIFSGPEYLIYKLTRNAVTILPEKRFVPAYWDDELLNAQNIPLSKLPPFYSIGQKYGEVKKEVIDYLALDVECAEPLPVFGAGPDFVAALIGTNTLEPGKICDRSGSSEGYNFCIPRFISYPGLRTLPSVMSEYWNISALIPNSSKLNRKKRIAKIKQNIALLKKMAEENKLEFPKSFTSTGGQTKDKKWMEMKARELNIRLLVSSSASSELFGDAAVAWFALGKYKTLEQAAQSIFKEDIIYENI